MGLEEGFRGYDCEWQHDVQGKTVKEGDTIHLGGWAIGILETPGHSSCSLTAYVPEIKALFPSDGGGIPFGSEISPAGRRLQAARGRNLPGGMGPGVTGQVDLNILIIHITSMHKKEFRPTNVNLTPFTRSPCYHLPLPFKIIRYWKLSIGIIRIKFFYY